MMLTWHNWRINSYERGYCVQRRINATRWKAEGFYPDLIQAVQSVFDQRVLGETKDYTIDLTDLASARSYTLELYTKLEGIKAELVEVISHSHGDKNA